jgi:DNA helicase-2/ATP-dependent DNA helicase PcrA
VKRPEEPVPQSTQDLTPSQRDAVTHVDGPLLVLAGAGSGKTRVITQRVANLIQTGVEPRHILAITFTNKAAQEMQSRIAALTSGARVWVSTFHAFCARTLRRYADRVGYSSGFTILDDDDQRAALRESLVETGTDPKQYGLPKVRWAIDQHKDHLRTPAQAKEEADGPFDRAVADAYAYYQDLLVQSNAMDFGDLLFQTVRLLQMDEVRDVLANRHRYLLIDEYQDTNHAQYMVAKLLAERHRNLCATGDPNQSIYAWRGADISNILEFERDYPEAKVVKLEQNFRSTQTILDAANGLIAHNSERREYELKTTAEEGQPLQLSVEADEYAEARYAARVIRQRREAGVPADEIAVFYRANALSRALEVTLLERGIPFRVVGSVPFYSRKEVKDVLSYLRVVQNAADDIALSRIANVPPRYVGKTTLRKVKARGREDEVHMLEAARRMLADRSLKGRSARGLSEPVGRVDRLRDRASAERRVEEVLRTILIDTNYREYLSREYPDPENREDRLMNLESLLAGARDYDLRTVDLPAPGLSAPQVQASRSEAPPSTETETPADLPLFADAMPLFASAPAPAVEEDASFSFGALAEDPDTSFDFGALAGDDDHDDPGFGTEVGGILGFLEHVALVSGLEEKQAQGPERVSLMTVHTAKGLEFDTVIVIGFEDGLFPNSRALEDPSGLEEERRLAYVALTRAKKRLFLTRANWRTRHGRTMPSEPSCFLFQIPAEVFPAGSSPSEIERRYSTYADDDTDGVDPPHDDDAPNWGRQRPARRPGLAHPSDRAAPPAWRRGLVRAPTKAQRQEKAETDLVAKLAALSTSQAEGPGALRPGDRVRHEQFGEGVIEQVRGSKMSRRAKVRFGRPHGVKDLVLQYARLTRLDG